MLSLPQDFDDAALPLFEASVRKTMRNFIFSTTDKINISIVKKHSLVESIHGKLDGLQYKEAADRVTGGIYDAGGGNHLVLIETDRFGTLTRGLCCVPTD